MPVPRDEVPAHGVAPEPAPLGCPGDADLARFVGPMMAGDDSSALARHIAACATCRRKIVAFQTTVVGDRVAPAPFALPAAAAATGQRLGRFTLARQLGRGG